MILEVRKLLGLVIEIGEPEIIFLQLFQQSGDRDTDSKEFDNEPHRWRRNIPAI